MTKITLRLTDEQHATLVAAAGDNHRSMQGEIIHRVFPPRLGATPAQTHREARPDPKPEKRK